MNTADRPTVKQQGLVVAERDNNGWLVMFPDGDVKHFHHRGLVEGAAKAWFKHNLGDRAVGIGRIEWRDDR